MVTYIIRRLLMGLLVIIMVSLIVFFSVRLLPGDPVLIYVAQQSGGGGTFTQEQLDELRHEYGLDKPVPIQYLDWVKGVLTGDLGESIRYREDVGQLLSDRLPVTLYLGLISVAVSTILGVFFGLIAAIRRESTRW
jgi:peptide/nickel transport system permease protein